MAIFMNGLQYKSSITTHCYSFPDLPLHKIKQIITKLIYGHKPSPGIYPSSVDKTESKTAENSSYQLISQAVSIAQQRADRYANDATATVKQLSNEQQLREPYRCIHHILQTIEYRQQAIVRSNQHQLQLQLELAFAAKAELEAHDAPNPD
jgi:hypothetical protein